MSTPVSIIPACYVEDLHSRTSEIKTVADGLGLRYHENTILVETRERFKETLNRRKEEEKKRQNERTFNKRFF